MDFKSLKCSYDLRPVLVRSARRPTVYCSVACREQARRFRREQKAVAK